MNSHEKAPRFPKAERPISPAYKEIDSDLARDNIENDLDLTAADEQDV